VAADHGRRCVPSASHQVVGTARHGSAYSSAYGQIRFDWKISSHLTGVLDTVILSA